ncbi:inorganic phosphate transporter [Paenibacillus chitinolyticus]|uniref:Inorganic phosphate transporter n=1 Tax=Paenibacillus chitinolyticus TaxID=79263 RepID=A0A410WVL5_9BACL|nr:inorganic phosphate transporter [Paenibacillus chitinolyticus]MCY9589326.1 inorganic phosphate transporter [Paenibacillus chitinolyticus]MCY9594399.1 inorganic phosphate transporter [Paenibacillus chitinolyticus]QAV18351.1 inorganic phosphate transporter [Paenibacillus chitinolyticus]GKS13908.1 inorganic phosphate transporter [Paenibacillus chitinolyticus]
MTTTVLITLIAIVFLALAFDFINGFHDTANAVATSISTRAMSPKVAIISAACLNFVGALYSSEVAKTIGSGIADPSKINHGEFIVIAALLSAIIWNLATWYYAIPSSSSHTLIGSIVGAVLAGAGADYVKWGGLGKIVLILVLSPIVAFVAGYIIMTIIKYLVILTGNKSRSKLNRVFKFFQILSAWLLSFSHGGNDAQKAMGIIVFGLVAAGAQTTMDVPLWVKIAAATAMGLGTSIGGWKIIKTISKNLIKIEPINGFASDLTSSIVIQTSTHMGMPLSTTHVISSAIIGSGSVLRFHEVKWGTVTRMIVTWIITIPISIILSYVLYTVLFKFFV